jgi:hypothetical protein
VRVIDLTTESDTDTEDENSTTKAEMDTENEDTE